jgi:hypothetical protein
MTSEYPKSLPVTNNGGCPSGYHKRESYTSPLGHRVTARCVRSTTVYKNTSKQHKEKTLVRMTHRLRGVYIPTIKSLTRRGECPPGQIERKAYVRKYTTAVREKGFTVRRASGTTYRIFPKASSSVVGPKCVKNEGKPGKGPQRIGPLRKGELKRHGYSILESDDRRRHGALRRAIQSYGALGVYRKLDAVSKLMKSTHPDHAKKVAKDRNWLKAHFSIKAF